MKIIDKVSEQLQAQKFTTDQLAAIEKAVRDNLPAQVYVIAVWFIGAITLLSALGALFLLPDGNEAESVWVAVGAGLGALAGIFSSRD